MTAVLIKEQDVLQQPVYYVSKVFQASEKYYTKAEKLIFTLLTVPRKLRQYFQSYHIEVLTDQLLKDILGRMATSGRMIKWSIQLSEFSVDCKHRKTIKA